MANRKIARENYLGRVQYVATCTEVKEPGSREKCGHKMPGGDKRSDAEKAWRDHDRRTHKPQRDRAAREERDAKRQKARDDKQARKDYKKSFENEQKRNAREVAKDIARGRIKPPKGEWTNADIAKLKSDYGQAAADAAKKLQETPIGHTRSSSGLRTKGIPNVPDGQKVTGLVYDKDGKRVPYETLQRYIQGY